MGMEGTKLMHCQKHFQDIPRQAFAKSFQVVIGLCIMFSALEVFWTRFAHQSPCGFAVTRQIIENI